MHIEVINQMLVRRMGDAGARKILCLHGFADSGLMFVPLAETVLPESFELIIVDLPGFGGSPQQPDVTDIQGYAAVVADLARQISPQESVGLVGHSIASAIAVAAVDKLANHVNGVFSIEGNLTEADAYFSGRAADWDAAAPFKQAFLKDIWEMAVTQAGLRRYFGGAVMAQPEAMWHLGKDAKQVSVEDAVGHAYRALGVPSLYYWSSATTPASTQAFIQTHAIPNRQYMVESHWPPVDDPQTTAQDMLEFFRDMV